MFSGFLSFLGKEVDLGRPSDLQLNGDLTVGLPGCGARHILVHGCIQKAVTIELNHNWMLDITQVLLDRGNRACWSRPACTKALSVSFLLLRQNGWGWVIYEEGIYSGLSGSLRAWCWHISFWWGLCAIPCLVGKQKDQQVHEEEKKEQRGWPTL